MSGRFPNPVICLLLIAAAFVGIFAYYGDRGPLAFISMPWGSGDAAVDEKKPRQKSKRTPGSGVQAPDAKTDGDCVRPHCGDGTEPYTPEDSYKRKNAGGGHNGPGGGKHPTPLTDKERAMLKQREDGQKWR